MKLSSQSFGNFIVDLTRFNMSQGLQKQGGRRGVPYPRSWMNRKRQRAAAARRTTTGSVMTNGFFDLPLRHRNTQVKLCLKMVLKFQDLRNFAITNSFYEMHAMRHLWSNLKTCRPYFWKKEFECTYFKTIF